MGRTLAVLSVLLTGCYGHDVLTSAVRLGPAFPPHSRPVAIYFGSAPPVPFEQIGLIEVVGASTTSTEELIARLRTEAQALGADGVISVNKQYKSRASGDAVGDILGALACASDIKHCHAQRSSQEEYSAPVLSGVAVKLNPRAAVRVSAQPASLPPLIQPPVPDDLPRMR